MDDKILVERFRGGDGEAFELLVRLHYRSAYAIAFRFMLDHGGADDVVQESFMKAHNAIASFRGESSFKSWLLRITSNTAKNALRARGRRQLVPIEDLEIGAKHRDFTRMESGQTAELLKLCVARLPEKQRRSLELRIYEDLSFKEIAEVMECPFDTAKANFRHALINLKKLLSSAEQDSTLRELQEAFESLTEDDGHE